jgi:hypothetical protein
MRTPDQSAGRATANATPTSTRPKRRLSLTFGTLLALIVGAFLLGLVPMWWTANSRANELAALNERHEEVELENALARAALLARQGEYEAAREAASHFFTVLNRELVSPDEDAANTDALRASLTDRDEIITLLARSDPASADRLAELYMNYRAAQAGLPSPTPR